MQLTTVGERGLVEALQRGDEAAFMSLVEELTPSMLRVARLYVPTQAIAEDVVQDAWFGVLRGIDRFEGRSSLKTWIFRILTNTAKTRGIREGRSIPFSSLGGDEPDGPVVDPDRFLGDDTRFPGHWAAPPRAWEGGGPPARSGNARPDRPRDRELPPAQAVVITMRDVEGFDADEVRNALDISETNQRVLLHRARSKVRRALEEYME